MLGVDLGTTNLPLANALAGDYRKTALVFQHTQNQRQISMGISDSLSTRSTELPSISSSTGLKP